ncbi:MAG: type III-B CRISPR module RAMP protein Cmr6 [Candidatus Omnitrophica bacterium]|nr:type III-B CRISPR module RAMP protein Cmr6 [Candidatus Omnitrophota bacterium]
MPVNTRAVLGQNAEKCESRSLFVDRFANPNAKEEERKTWFKDADKRRPEIHRLQSWAQFLGSLIQGQSRLLFAQLKSRLMVNMAGGVMENAGLCLDRFGLPYVPGSAVKGCARRMALAALHDWCEIGSKPVGAGNPGAGSCAPFATRSEMLAAIARVFGWSEQDWKLRNDFRSDEAWEKKRSDFAWACGDSLWQSMRNEALRTLQNGGNHPVISGSAPSGSINCCSDSQSTTSTSKRVMVRDYAGTVSFLPAYPLDLNQTGRLDGLSLEIQAIGKLELDIVTVHHKKYYAGPGNGNNSSSSSVWQRDWGNAPDIEEPVPNVFPAVAAGHVFVFAVVPMRRVIGGQVSDVPVQAISGGQSDATRLANLEAPTNGRPEVCPTALAHCWLAEGLQIFGLGAKTNAGYGWFDCRNEVQIAIQDALANAQQKRQQEQRRHENELRRKAEEEIRRRNAENERIATANMTLEQKTDYEFAQLNDERFRGRLESFTKRELSEQQAIVRALRLPSEQAGSRRKFWEDLKNKARKGGKPAQIEQAIRQLSKQLFPGKEGKMP